MRTHEQAPAAPAPQARRVEAAPGAMPLPYLRDMERSFGRDLGDVRAYTGRAGELRRFGAQAMTVGDTVVFAVREPAPALVAHETAHVIQNRNAGAAVAMASGIVAPRDSPAEAEADRVAALVEAHGPGAALPAITAAPAAHIQLAPDPVAVELDPPLVVDLLEGDRFRVTIAWKRDGASRLTTLEIDVDYAGKDDISSHRVNYSLPLDPARRPSATLRKPRGESWKSIEIDLYGDGRHVTRLAHSVVYLTGWIPKARLHQFEAKGPGGYSKRDDVVVKSRIAMPATIANQSGEALPAGASAAVTAQPRATLPFETAAIAGKRLLDELVSEVPRSALGQLQKRVAADHAQHASARPDPAAAARFTRLIEVIHAVRPMMKSLEAADKRDAYLDGIAGDAIRLISDVKQLYGAAIAEAYYAGTREKRDAADDAFNALWYRIAWLYIESDRGVVKVIHSAADAVREIMDVRQHSGRLPDPKSRLDLILGVGTGGRRVEESLTREAHALRKDFLEGKTGSLSRISSIVENAQLVMGLAALLAANESFHAFKKEMDGIVGGAFNRFGRNMSGVCDDYIRRFEALLGDVERGLRANQPFEQLGKTAVDRFRDIVNEPKFKPEIDDIQSRIKWVKAVQLLGKVLVIVGAAAFTGGLAGAAIGGALEGAGATAGIVAAGEFAAEVVTFTIVSRLGNKAVLGAHDTNFAEDLVTNTLMFGFLKAATAGYSRVFKLIAKPKAHKVAYTVGAGITGMVSLQIFAEAHHLVKEGKWMSRGDRWRGVFQNATLLVALGLASHLAKPLNRRVHDKVLVFTAKHLPGRLAKIGTKIADVQAALAALRRGDPAAAANAPELLHKIEQIWNEELGVLAEATRREATPAAHKAFAETVKGYVAEIAKLELQLAQGGVDVDLGPGRAANTFRPISPGFVAFRPEGREVLEAFHKENRGSFEKINDDLYTGKVNGERTFYVPEHSVKKLLLEEPVVKDLDVVEARKPVADANTDAKAFGKAARAHAETVGKAVGEQAGPLGATAAEIEGRALEAEIQMEVGLRILDPLFGETSSSAFKDAERAATSHQDAAVKARETKAFLELAEARIRLQKQMLDVLRNPALDIAARKRALHNMLGELEATVKKSGRVNADAMNFAAARKQIDALAGETFKNMLAVDAEGNLTQNGVKVGTLRQLIAKVKAINNLFRKNKVPRELALSVSTPRDPSIPAEVKVLSRVPREPPATVKKPKSPVDPTDQSVEGTVVDIGVGLGDFAREAGGETGELVKTELGTGYADPAMIRRKLTWEHTGPRIDADSVLVLGDALQTLQMLFSAKSVKRMFINHINASYTPGGALYKNLARGLGRVMAKDGRVEIQWTDEPETTNGVTKPRGHITGDALLSALEATGVRDARGVKVAKDAQPVLEYDYSVEAPRDKTGVPRKAPPTPPVPKFRWILTFGG